MGWGSTYFPFFLSEQGPTRANKMRWISISHCLLPKDEEKGMQDWNWNWSAPLMIRVMHYGINIYCFQCTVRKDLGPGPKMHQIFKEKSQFRVSGRVRQSDSGVWENEKTRPKMWKWKGSQKLSICHAKKMKKKSSSVAKTRHVFNLPSIYAGICTPLYGMGIWSNGMASISITITVNESAGETNTVKCDSGIDANEKCQLFANMSIGCAIEMDIVEGDTVTRNIYIRTTYMFSPLTDSVCVCVRGFHVYLFIANNKPGPPPCFPPNGGLS